MRYLLLLSTLLLTTGVEPREHDHGDGDWVMDRSTSRIEFVADYVGADVPGRFDTFDVTLSFDPLRPSEGRLEVSVDVSSADLGDADLTATVMDKPWFDAATFAVAGFKSDAIVAVTTSSLRMGPSSDRSCRTASRPPNREALGSLNVMCVSVNHPTPRKMIEIGRPSNIHSANDGAGDRPGHLGRDDRRQVEPVPYRPRHLRRREPAPGRPGPRRGPVRE